MIFSLDYDILLSDRMLDGVRVKIYTHSIALEWKCKHAWNSYTYSDNMQAVIYLNLIN